MLVVSDRNYMVSNSADFSAGIPVLRLRLRGGSWFVGRSLSWGVLDSDFGVGGFRRTELRFVCRFCVLEIRCCRTNTALCSLDDLASSDSGSPFSAGFSIWIGLSFQ